jgi:hypothetical protein
MKSIIILSILIPLIFLWKRSRCAFFHWRSLEPTQPKPGEPWYVNLRCKKCGTAWRK